MPITEHLDFPSGIDLKALPILIGPSALNYYEIGERPAKTVCVITEADFDRLETLHPERVGKQGSDKTLGIEEVIFFRTIQLFCYNAIKANFLTHENFAVISLYRMYLITSLNFTNSRREKEMGLILERMDQSV